MIMSTIASETSQSLRSYKNSVSVRSVSASFRKALLLMLLGSTCAYGAVPSLTTRWNGANGEWTKNSKWSAGVPTVFREATVGGLSEVVIPSGSFAVADLRVGTEAGDRATVQVNGAHLLVRQDSSSSENIAAAQRGLS